MFVVEYPFEFIVTPPKWLSLLKLKHRKLFQMRASRRPVRCVAVRPCQTKIVAVSSHLSCPKVQQMFKQYLECPHQRPWLLLFLSKMPVRASEHQQNHGKRDSMSFAKRNFKNSSKHEIYPCSSTRRSSTSVKYSGRCHSPTRFIPRRHQTASLCRTHWSLPYSQEGRWKRSEHKHCRL